MLADSFSPSELQFDQKSRASHSEQPVPLGGVPRALHEAAEMAGLDPIAELYNEALRYASEGHLRLARERLQMLLCMRPDDGEARLLLARVHVAGQRWQEALAAMDEAATAGKQVSPHLRRAVEDHLHAEEASSEEEKTAHRAREQGEIKALRQEARRLRSENASLVGRCADYERETRKWAYATAGVSTLAIVFILGNLIFGGASNETVASTEIGEGPTVAAPLVAEEEAPQVAAAPVTATSIADKAGAALSEHPSLEGTDLTVEINGTSASLGGKVVSHRQLRVAERLLGGVGGVSDVTSEDVVIAARTRGTTHVVDKGDTLSQISQYYYGDSTRSKAILKANRSTLKGPSSLKIGQALVIPAIE